ncbi:MAG TPA: HindVP family restriction endonuclease, partial [Candidatus Sericytochromatia bacterium]
MINDNPTKPQLFGLTNSNRDFSLRSSWGKNQFNNSFPTALACYMHSQELEQVYLMLDQQFRVNPTKLNVPQLFGINPSSPHLFFAFESDYVPYRK